MIRKYLLKLTKTKVNPTFFNSIKKFYHPAREMMTKKNADFYSDPNVVGEDILRIICLHDKIKDASKVIMGNTWEEMGLDSLDYVEILTEIELEYEYDFGPTEWESFQCPKDVAEFMAKDYWAQKH